jgi:hypothetical protein
VIFKLLLVEEEREMGKSAKGLHFMLYVNDKDKFEAYKKICKQLGKKSISKEIMTLVSKDCDRLFALMEILEKEKKGDKKNE